MGNAPNGQFDVLPGHGRDPSGEKKGGAGAGPRQERDPVDLFLLECFRRASLLKGVGVHRPSSAASLGLYTGGGKVFSGKRPATKSSGTVKVNALGTEGRREKRSRKSGG